LAHKTSLNPPLFIEVLVQARKESRHVFELKDVNLASLYRLSIVFSGNVPTVRGGVHSYRLKQRCQQLF